MGENSPQPLGLFITLSSLHITVEVNIQLRYCGILEGIWQFVWEKVLATG